MITGIIDSVEVAYGKNSHTLSVAGRSKTKDLVDCSVVNSSNEFNNLSIKKLVENIIGIYKVAVSGADDSTKIPTFKVEQNGEKCFESIQRISETKAFRITDNPNGELLLTQASDVKSSNIIDGSNVLSARMVLDESNKYSKITVKGQARGSDDVNGIRATQLSASAEDETIGRTRELIIHAQNDATNADVKKLAEWEVAARSAKGFGISYTLQGWKGSAGKMWFENQLVPVRDKVLKVSDEYLIVSVEYVIGKGGTVVNLELADPNAYVPKPKITKKSTKAALGWDWDKT